MLQLCKGNKTGLYVPVKKESDMRVEIDTDLCVGCGCCIEVCRVGALEINDKVSISEDDCIDCGNCIEMCPADALFLR